MKKTTLLFLLIFIVLSCGKKQEKTEVDTADTLNVPTSPTDSAVILQKPIINVYLENSGSMDGYVKGNTGFEQAVYSYLSDVKISDITDSLNLFYINSKVIPQGGDIEDFIDKLEPASFKAKGGNRSESDISDVIKSALSAINDSTISILISDFIFSPGSNKKAVEYLTNQQIGIKSAFAESLKRNNLAVIVYQLTSEFSGQYYNMENKPTQINDKRPFYILITGNLIHLKNLIQKVDVKKMKGSGVENTYTAMKKQQSINFGIIKDHRIGSFEQISNTQIKKAKADKGNGFQFSFGTDFSSFIIDNSYLTNKLNYKVSDPNYSVEIVNSNMKISDNLHYTQVVKLNTKQNIITSTNIKVQLMNRLPNWIEDMNDEDGIDILSPGAMSKTYGIKYSLGGIFDAFTMQDSTYAEFNISILNK